MTQTSDQSTPFARRVFAMTCAFLLIAVVIGASRGVARVRRPQPPKRR